MKRCFATALACAWMVYGQRSVPAEPPAAATEAVVMDAVALDAAGHPVTDLTGGDLELEQGGGVRKVTGLTWFDTRLHTASTRVGQLPALDLLPDEIRRNLVVIVDDLGLTPSGIQAVRDGLNGFLSRGMGPGDRMAILRGSGGTSDRQQLTSNTRLLSEAVGDIEYLGGSASAASASSSCWQVLGYAMEGMREIRGRKTVVLFSENPRVAGAWDRVEKEAARAAHAAGAAVYVIDPLRETPGGASAAHGTLEALARETGGRFGGNFAQVLENEQGYYAIAFEPGRAVDAPGATPAVGVTLKARRAGVTMRARAGYLSRRERVDFEAPANRAAVLTSALKSPFAPSDIRVRLTALFSDYAKEGPVIDVIVYVDVRDVTLIHDLKGVYHGLLHLMLTAYTDDGRLSAPVQRDHPVTLTAEEYRAGAERGLRLPTQMRVFGPGTWQMRAVVADGASDGTGSATQFVEVPSVRQGGLAISGIVLRRGTAGDHVAVDPQSDPGVRVFQAGDICTFQYRVYNMLTGADKKSTLEVQTRIFAGGRAVFTGAPGRVTFAEAPEGARRQISGQLQLDPQLVPGFYVLQVTVRDTLAAGETRSVTQSSDFRVRE